MIQRQVKTAEKSHTLGANHNNDMADQNGLDEIDLWAMNIGQAEKTKHSITPARKHLSCV